MILVVSLRPVLTRVQFLAGTPSTHGGVVQAAHFEAAGDGTAALRVLQALGHPARFLGLGGGAMADEFVRALHEESLEGTLVETASPLPVCVRHHRWNELGELETSVYEEPAARVASAEMSRLLAEIEPLLADLDGLLICGDDSSPGLDFAVWQLLQEARSRGVATMLVAHGSVLDEASSGGPRYVVTGRRDVDTDRVADKILGSGGQTLVVTDGPDPVLVVTAKERVRLQPPKASDRGGRGAREALGAAMLYKLDAGWDVLSSVSFGIGAGAAQVQKEVGGRVAFEDVDGFWRQVRRTE